MATATTPEQTRTIGLVATAPKSFLADMLVMVHTGNHEIFGFTAEDLAHFKDVKDYIIAEAETRVGEAARANEEKHYFRLLDHLGLNKSELEYIPEDELDSIFEEAKANGYIIHPHWSYLVANLRNSPLV